MGDTTAERLENKKIIIIIMEKRGALIFIDERENKTAFKRNEILYKKIRKKGIFVKIKIKRLVFWWMPEQFVGKANGCMNPVQQQVRKR